LLLFLPSPSSRLTPVSQKWLASEVEEVEAATEEVVVAVADTVEEVALVDPTELPWAATAVGRIFPFLDEVPFRTFFRTDFGVFDQSWALFLQADLLIIPHRLHFNG
jgi:hypothetical protein